MKLLTEMLPLCYEDIRNVTLKNGNCHPFIVHQIYLNIGYCSVNGLFLDDNPILPLADFAKCSK